MTQEASKQTQGPWRVEHMPALVAALEACVESIKLIAQEITKSPTGEFEEWSHPANSIRMAEDALRAARRV